MIDLNQLNPLWVPVVVFLASTISPIVGWAMAYLESKKSQEAALAKTATGAVITLPPLVKVDWLQVLASAIIGLIAAGIEFGLYSSAISVGFPDLLTAAVAGFAGERNVKKFLGL